MTDTTALRALADHWQACADDRRHNRGQHTTRLRLDYEVLAVCASQLREAIAALTSAADSERKAFVAGLYEGTDHPLKEDWIENAWQRYRGSPADRAAANRQDDGGSLNGPSRLGASQNTDTGGEIILSADRSAAAPAPEGLAAHQLELSIAALDGADAHNDMGLSLTLTQAADACRTALIALRARPALSDETLRDVADGYIASCAIACVPFLASRATVHTLVRFARAVLARQQESDCS